MSQPGVYSEVHTRRKTEARMGPSPYAPSLTRPYGLPTKWIVMEGIHGIPTLWMPSFIFAQVSIRIPC